MSRRNQDLRPRWSATHYRRFVARDDGGQRGPSRPQSLRAGHGVPGQPGSAARPPHHKPDVDHPDVVPVCAPYCAPSSTNPALNPL